MGGVPVSGLVNGDGNYDLALVPLSTTGLKLAARESGKPAELAGSF